MKTVPAGTAPDSSKAPSKLELIQSARAALQGEARSSEELRQLYRQLEEVDQFDYASELLRLRIKQDEERGIPVKLADRQRLVKYIYKDNSLSAQFKFDRALQDLNAADSLAGSDNCETLGLAGAIYKRKWQHDHQYRHLMLARHYYKRGFDLWKSYLDSGADTLAVHRHNDSGWNAINYAYLLELQAVNDLEETGAATGYRNFAADGLLEAQNTRVYLLNRFLTEPFTAPQLRSADYAPWVLATIAEAYFGLCRYREAISFIEQYKARYLDRPWELRSFGQQLFAIAYLQGVRQRITERSERGLHYSELPEAGKVDQDGIGRCLKTLDISGGAVGEIRNDGKTGLALSGGGFRASLFHIGVLAALAERDELKDIEVISCVSGGSIIGAYYYLQLKLLLEEKGDEDITRQDYIDLVKETAEHFLKGVQKNLRMRLFSSLPANFRMLSDNYSRTNRMGELYEEHLFRPIIERHLQKQKRRAAEGTAGAAERDYRELAGRPIRMDDLFICPDGNFNFATDNWKRRAKVPQLILNATSVNTGHNWQFTASWMGEPAAGIIADIDVKSRLRRMYYRDAPPEYRDFRLGYAVGASSCVPVMFEPLPMTGLYPGIDLQLIDGGLHDNQGIASILEEECRNVFISDASAQLPTNSGDVSGPFPLFMRTDNILQERLRELQFGDMRERRATTLLNRLLSVHLKNGITTPAVNWKNCTDPQRTISHVDPTIKEKNLMPYGVLRETQQLVSEIRTDLDAFHDMEAYALMYNGYVQTHYELSSDEDSPAQLKPLADWNFLAIEAYMKDPAEAEKIRKQLTVASRVPFKVYFLLPKPVQIGIPVVLALTLLFLLYWYRDKIPAQLVFSTSSIAVAVLLIVVGFFSKPLSVVLNPKGYARTWLKRILVAIGGWVLFNAYLGLFNGWYLKVGRLKRRKGATPPPSVPQPIIEQLPLQESETLPPTATEGYSEMREQKSLVESLLKDAEQRTKSRQARTIRTNVIVATLLAAVGLLLLYATKTYHNLDKSNVQLGVAKIQTDSVLKSQKKRNLISDSLLSTVSRYSPQAQQLLSSTLSKRDSADQYNRQGYALLKQGNLEAAMKSFYASEEIYNGYRDSYELYFLLWQNRQHFNDPSTKANIMNQIRKSFNWRKEI